MELLLYNCSTLKKIDFDNEKIGLTVKELVLLRKLDTPQKIQTFVSSIPQNFERNGDSCMSARDVLRTNRAHCIEGAVLAALAFWIHGKPPLLMDLSANDEDDDHVIALFKENGLWGAISKGNHSYVRYRDPVYRTPRELAMSYFHEYYNTKGDKTLRTHSGPFDLRALPDYEWIRGESSWGVAERLCEIAHHPFFPKSQEHFLRPIEKIEHRIMKLRVHTR